MSLHLAKGSKCPEVIKGKLRFYANKFCPYSERIQLILEAKEIPYDIIHINLTSLPEWFTKINPAGKVPAIELENGEIIHETYIIAQYIDEKYSGRKLISKDQMERTKDMLFLENFKDVIYAMNRLIERLGRRSTKDINIIKNAVDLFEQELGTRGKFYGGNRPSLIDFFIWPWAERTALLVLCCPQLHLKKDDYKNIMTWYNNMLEIPAIKKVVIESETHIKFFETYCSGVPVYDIA